MTKSTYFRKVNEIFPLEPYTIVPNSDRYDFAAMFELNGIKDRECIRISAANQRKLGIKIGARALRWNSSLSRFELIWSTAFGQDWEVQEVEFAPNATGTDRPKA